MTWRPLAGALVALCLTASPAIAAGPPCDSVAGNLVHNCGFETPVVASGTFSALGPGSNIDGWTVGPGDAVDLTNKNFSGGYPVNNGNQSLDLNHDHPGQVFQDIPTSAGQLYRVTVQMSGAAQPLVTQCPSHEPQVLRISAGSASQQFSFLANRDGSIRFDAMTFDFGASPGSSTRLTLAARNDGCVGPIVDDVTVVPASEPAPVLGRSVAGRPVSGTVLAELPGSGKFVQLRVATSLPVGTIVDARHGRVRITATSGGKVYSADFYGGEFQIAQLARKGSTADLKLFGGTFAGCPRAARPAAGKKNVRRLWGSGSGPFRTVGRFSAATVRGTTWLTKDTCSGTLTVVKSGSVSVRDFVRRRNVIVRAGHQYLAAPRRR